MAKKTATGARILEDTSAAATDAPQQAIGETTSGKAKKNEHCTVLYLDAKGEAHKGIPDDCVGIRHTAKDDAGEVQIQGDIVFADLNPLVALKGLAFGLNTAYRNTYNTNKNGADAEKALDALQNRLSGWEAGDWNQIGEGDGIGGIPTVIEAIKRAYVAAGKDDATAQKAYDDSLAHFRSLDKEGREAQTKKWKSNPRVQVAFDTINSERAAAKLAKSQAKAAADTGAVDSGLDI
jgi:hypothetical protein